MNTIKKTYSFKLECPNNLLETFPQWLELAEAQLKVTKAKHPGYYIDDYNLSINRASETYFELKLVVLLKPITDGDTH